MAADEPAAVEAEVEAPGGVFKSISSFDFASGGSGTGDADAEGGGGGIESGGCSTLLPPLLR